MSLNRTQKIRINSFIAIHNYCTWQCAKMMHLYAAAFPKRKGCAQSVTDKGGFGRILITNNETERYIR